MPTHNHNHKEHKAHNHDDGRKLIRARAKDTPGIVCIERNIHDEAIVISGTLTLEYGAVDLKAWIAEELENAAQAIGEKDGIVGHIKAAVTVSATDVISVTDEKAMMTRSPGSRARIALAAIVFKVEPEEAENIIRKALSGVRARLRSEKQREGLQ